MLCLCVEGLHAILNAVSQLEATVGQRFKDSAVYQRGFERVSCFCAIWGLACKQDGFPTRPACLEFSPQFWGCWPGREGR